MLKTQIDQLAAMIANPDGPNNSEIDKLNQLSKRFDNIINEAGIREFERRQK